MSRRFEGAITTPDDGPRDSARPPGAARPRRPLSIEISAAILIVGGLSTIVATVADFLSGDPAANDPGARPVVTLILGLNVLTLIVGLFVRWGQAWLVCINVVAIVLFLELTAIPSGSAIVMLLAILDGFVFVALARNRAWFDWQPPEEHPSR